MEHLNDNELIEELSERLRAKDRAYQGLVAATRKLEELNDKLSASEKVKSSFLSNIRNEINNPLTSVLTLAEILISNDEMPEYAHLKSVVGLIHKEAFALNFQLRNIFAAAELEAGEATPSITNADAASVVRDAVNSFQHRAVEKRVVVKAELSDEVKEKTFRTDAEMLHRVCSNLLSNAIEYSPPEGTVLIKAWREGEGLKVSVTDRGPGIAEAEHAMIFERFRQLEAGPTKAHSGHGLGLSIVKAALELLGGGIKVESGKGEGAVFTATILEAAPSDDYSIDGTEYFAEAGSERF